MKSVQAYSGEFVPAISPSARPIRRYCGQCPLIIACLIFFLMLNSMPAGNPEPIVPFTPVHPELRSRITAGIEKTIVNDFSGARELYRELISQYPEEPVGYFYYAAALQAEMLDREDYRNSEEFRRYIRSALEKAEEQRKLRPQDAWLYFYEGSAYLYLSFMESKLGKWWPAYRHARKGASKLEDALRIDSTLTDAYLGIGSFKYWKSSKAGMLTFLPFFSDERAKGIRLVRKAIRRGLFVKWIARDQLAWILLDSQQYHQAIALARENLSAFPDSRFFKWTLVEVLDRSGRAEEAYPLYNRLVREVRRLPGNNHYNELVCLLRMAEIDYQRQRYEVAASLVSQALALHFPESMEKRVRSKIKALLRLSVDCQRKLASLE